MPASRGSHCAPTPRARASSSLPGPSSPVLPLYILCDITCEQICKSGVKVYKKLSKNALHYGAGPSFWTAQFPADLVKRTYHTKHGGGAPGRASPRPSSRRPPTAGQQLANWGITTTLPSRRQRSLCGQGQTVVDWRAQPTLASGSKPVTRLPSKRPALPVPLMGRY